MAHLESAGAPYTTNFFFVDWGGGFTGAPSIIKGFLENQVLVKIKSEA